jgi:hypothetical protein
MTTLPEIEERLRDQGKRIANHVGEQTADDIRTLLGMVREAQGQLALIQSVRVAEEAQLAEVTRELDAAREVIACIVDDLSLEHVDAYDENHGLPWYVRMIVEHRESEIDRLTVLAESRPAISAEDADCLRWHMSGPPFRDDDAGMMRLWNALRAHALTAKGGDDV